MAAHAIKAGEGDVFVAGGVETVSRFRSGMSDGAPGTHNARFADAEARTVDRSAGGQTSWEPIAGLPDIYIAMGQTAENVAEYAKVTREEMDEFAALSQQRAVASQENGFFEREITPVTDARRHRRHQGRRPAPGNHGRGALAAQAGVPARRHRHRRQRVPAQRRRRRGAGDERGRAPRRSACSRWRASSPAACRRSTPRSWGSVRSRRAGRPSARAGLSIDDIDLVEINEAFAAQVVPSARDLGIPWDKLNVHGGAIALGHPFGMTGARIMTTLLNGLDDAGARYGLESMCVGGGQGMAMVVERLS